MTDPIEQVAKTLQEHAYIDYGRACGCGEWRAWTVDGEPNGCWEEHAAEQVIEAMKAAVEGSDHVAVEEVAEMTDPTEQVAEAIRRADYSEQRPEVLGMRTWDELSEGWQDYYLALARAAIDALQLTEGGRPVQQMGERDDGTANMSTFDFEAAIRSARDQVRAENQAHEKRVEFWNGYITAMEEAAREPSG